MRNNDLTPAWRFSTAALRALRAAAARAPRREACGALLGHAAQPPEIRRVVRLPNAASDPRTAYLIPAASVRRIEQAAARAGLDLVGFFHSHPDGTTLPSARDLAHAWPGYLYVIVPSAVAEPTAWRLRDDRSGFDAVPWQRSAAA